MSTPSPQPLDYDLVSPYAPKYARDPGSPPAAEEPKLSQPRPAAIENDHDAKILDEIEASLRAMIAAEHAPPQAPVIEEEPEQTPQAEAETSVSESEAPQEEPAPPTIDALEAPALADDLRSPEHRYYDALRVQEVMQQVAHKLAHRNAQEAMLDQPEPEPEPERPMEEYRRPPAFLARSMEPIRFDDPLDEAADEQWPKARLKPRNSASTLFVRFGFAAGGAAVVMLFALPDLRARFIEAVGTPLATVTSNAATVFGEGKPQPARNEPIPAVAVRTEPVILTRESNRFDAPAPKFAAAGPVSAMPDTRNAQPSPAPEAQPQRETVMTPIAPPRATQDVQNRGIWHGPPGRTEGDSSTNGVATRPLATEEIELLRKMGNDFIAAGDFAGARGVLERAAEAGDASAAFALAATYDPAALARFKVKGLVPDNAKAALWYERARDLGSQEAPVRLKALARSN